MLALCLLCMSSRTGQEGEEGNKTTLSIHILQSYLKTYAYQNAATNMLWQSLQQQSVSALSMCRHTASWHTCMYTHTYTHIHIYTHTYIHTYIHICTHTFVHTSHIHTHTHTHTHIHTHTHKHTQHTQSYNISSIMDTWTLQMGYPVVTVTKTSPTTASISQQRFFFLKPNGTIAPSPYKYVQHQRVLAVHV